MIFGVPTEGCLLLILVFRSQQKRHVTFFFFFDRFIKVKFKGKEGLLFDPFFISKLVYNPNSIFSIRK